MKFHRELRAPWNSLWAATGAARENPVLFHMLLLRYDEPQRRYHTLQHLEECLHHFEALRHRAAHAVAVGLALWFHDAIYDVRRHDNEARSAAWASQELRAAGLDEALIARVAELIMATCHNATPRDIDAQVVVDIDLWILGAPPPRFDEYERQVREEYRHVGDAAFRQGRLAVLRQFLARPRIYGTEEFFGLYEGQARENLGRSIGKLTLPTAR